MPGAGDPTRLTKSAAAWPRGTPVGQARSAPRGGQVVDARRIRLPRHLAQVRPHGGQPVVPGEPIVLLERGAQLQRQQARDLAVAGQQLGQPASAVRSVLVNPGPDVAL